MTVAQEIDQFPVGMRVLAVDDNPTCLMVLESLLRKCQYHVTTTSHATTALKLLRENRNNFDLVISDVDMPDMDGFKLLELVGLEMDLPVIMLSAYGDTKLVMKGISHGACDYLLKPVRIEELKNIWQHVLRRRKFDSPEQKNFDKVHGEPGEVGESFTGTGDSDSHGKLSRKRKDQNDNEDEKQDENGQLHEDPSSQKKPRVVWSPELHRKFVAAVNQLGIEKSVPKKILEMMNVEKLTRENVASHLQKYRLYLKRISCVASQQTDMLSSMRGSDSSFVHNGTLNLVANIQSIAPGRSLSEAYNSLAPHSIIGRLNTPAGLGMCGLSSSGMALSGHLHDSRNPTNGMPSVCSDIRSMDPNISILQGMPMSLDDQLQYRRCSPQGNSETSSKILDSGYLASSAFLGAKVDLGNTSNCVFENPNNSVILASHFEDVQMKEVIGFRSSLTAATVNLEYSKSVCRSSDYWTDDAVQQESFLRVSTSNDLGDKMPSFANCVLPDSQNIQAFVSVLSGERDTRMEFQCQTPLVIDTAGESLNFTLKQDWNDLEPNTTSQSDLICGSVNSLGSTHGALGPFSFRSATANSHVSGDGFSSAIQMNLIDPLPRQQAAIQFTATDFKQDNLEDQMIPQGHLDNNCVGSLEDLISVMMKEGKGYS